MIYNSLKIVLIVYVIGIIGCAQPLPTILSVDPNNLTNEQAVLIVSAGTDKTCIAHGSAFVVKESSRRPMMGDSIGVFQLNNGFVKSDFDSGWGKVYTTILKPGEYDFWLYMQHPYASFSGDTTFTESFVLEPGQVKYVGEVYSTGCSSVSVVIHDKSERDLKLLKQVKPDLILSEVTVQILRTK